jgi:hypothetical protein
MPEDAPVNTGAVSWPDSYAARVTARGTQTKLHLRAARDPGRRFGRVEVRPQRAVLTGAASVKVTCYSYRSGSIPAPWTPEPPAAPSG